MRRSRTLALLAAGLALVGCHTELGPGLPPGIDARPGHVLPTSDGGGGGGFHADAGVNDAFRLPFPDAGPVKLDGPL